MESIPGSAEAGGAGGASSYKALKRLDEQWLKMRSRTPVSGPAPEVVTRRAGKWEDSGLAEKSQAVLDVVVCGGTLGVFLATALALRGMKVAIIEKGPLRGRVQEWNVSRKELQELVHAGVLTQAEIEEVVAIEFNPSRVAFAGGTELWVTDILNLGVSPARLIEVAKKRFESVGGEVLELTGLSKLDVFDNGAVVSLDNGKAVVGRLLLDVMGNASPIVRQIRWGQHPDGVCLVVGACARGFENNSTSDLIYTHTDVTQAGESETQYFWEAFPAGSGPKDRTTYMFSYLDATPTRPSLEQMLEDYWDLMPEYQGVNLEDLEMQRVLFGCFPTFRASPLPSNFDRVLQVGDASGIQSPISFGGFGAITRHLGRLSDGLHDALQADLLDKKSLALLNPYLPNLSGVWMYQRAMSVRLDIESPPDFINNLLSINFQCMERLGDPAVRPFLQDVIQFWPQVRLLTLIMLTKPLFIPQIFRQVGLFPLFDWLRHFIALAMYTLLWLAVGRNLRKWADNLPKEQQFVWRRRFEAWQYGSGLDYHP
jgi:flavin-dependent dehydrogenase